MGDVGSLALGGGLGMSPSSPRTSCSRSSSAASSSSRRSASSRRSSSFKLTGKRDLPDGADPPPLREEGLARAEDHRPLLDHLHPPGARQSFELEAALMGRALGVRGWVDRVPRRMRMNSRFQPDRPSTAGQDEARAAGVRAALRNVRRTMGQQLAAPLDAQPSATGAAGPVDAVLAARSSRSSASASSWSTARAPSQATVQLPRPAVLPEAAGRVRARGARSCSGVASRIDYHRLYKLTYPMLAVVGRPARRCASSGFGHTRRRRDALARRSGRCTSSRPRWPSSRSSSGSRTRSRRRPSG